MMELEKAIQDPHDESRVRFLEGKDLTPSELQGKLEEVCFDVQNSDFIINQYIGWCCS